MNKLKDLSSLEIVEVCGVKRNNLQITHETLVVCCCIQNEVHRPKSQLTQASNKLPCSTYILHRFKGLVWILLTMCARSLQANRGGGAGLS